MIEIWNFKLIVTVIDRKHCFGFARSKKSSVKSGGKTSNKSKGSKVFVRLQTFAIISNFQKHFLC